MNRLAIIGAGLVSSLGRGVELNFESLLNGNTGCRPLQHFNPHHFNARNAYELPREALGMPDSFRATRLLCDAVRQAIVQSGLTDAELKGTPIVVGTGLRELRAVEQWHCDGKALLLDQLHFGAALREMLGFDLPCYTLSNACAASLYALGVGEDMLRLGDARHVIVAGCDVLTESMHGLLDRVQFNTPHCVQPFDPERRGVLMGEGASAVVLSTSMREAPHALGWLHGVGMNCDAFHETAPSPTGIEKAIRLGQQRAQVAPEEVDLIYLHGTGTALNDIVEAQAVTEVFASALTKAGKALPVTAIKSMTGHTSGASGLSSLVMGLMSLRTGQIPATRNTSGVIPELAAPIELVRTRRPASPLGRVQVNAFGFGGVNAVALISGAAVVPEPARRHHD